MPPGTHSVERGNSGDRHIGNPHQFRFPDDIDKALEKAAEAHNVSINWLVNMMVRRGLSKLRPPEEVNWFDE